MNNFPFFLLILFLGGFGVSSGSPFRQESGLWGTLDGQPSLLMAHRGEKVIMPEHTVGSYEIASIEKADYVEPDLVLTKDGHLVCFHDLTIREGTDILDHLEQFGHLMRPSWTIELDGKNKTFENEWFIADFDLEELRTLRVTQKSVGIRPQLFNELFQIPTFQEYLDVIHKLSYQLNRTIGVIPEIKHPKFHNQNRASANYMENEVLRVLGEYGYPIVTGDIRGNCNYTNATGVFYFNCGPILIQSFEFDSLAYLKTKSDIDLLQLADVSYLRHLTYEGLKEVAKVAKHFSVWKELMYTGVKAELEFFKIEYDEDEIERLGGFIPANDFVKEAHKLGMKMGLFTIYDSHEPSYRGCTLNCEKEDKRKELFYYFEMGVDGLFVENVQEAIDLRTEYDHMLRTNELEKEVQSLEAELEALRNSGPNLVPTKFSLFFIISILSAFL